MAVSEAMTRALSESEPRPPETATPLSRGVKISFGIGSIANGIKNITFTAYLIFFYNQVIGAPAAIVSAALALTLLVDAIVDPVLGRWSDMASTRWGRRHPFIIGSALPTAVFFVAVWFPPAGLTDVQTGFWLFGTAMLTRISISAFEINSQAMTAELVDDYTERTKLFSLRYWFLYIGQFGFSMIALLVFFVATPEFPRGQLNPDSYVGFALLGGILILVSILICGFGTRSRIPYLRQRSARNGKLSIGTHVREMFTAFKNRAFLAIFGFGVLKFTAIGLYAATSLYFGTYLFQFDSRQLAVLALDSVVAATIAAPLAPIMARRLGKRTSSILFSIVGVTLALLPLVLIYFDLFYLPGDPRLLVAMFVIGAAYSAMVAISLINTSSMLADVVEDSAIRTGRHEAGTFFAASSFMQQCSTALGLVASGLILTWSAFPQKAAGQTITPAMLDSLLLHYVPTSFLLWLIGCSLLLFYPITRQRHEQNLAVLKAREAEARDSLASDLTLGGAGR